jgi:hypothetical protein
LRRKKIERAYFTIAALRQFCLNKIVVFQALADLGGAVVGQYPSFGRVLYATRYGNQYVGTKRRFPCVAACDKIYTNKMQGDPREIC